MEPIVATPAKLFCRAEVGANKLRTGEWHVTHADFDHVNCSGGNGRVRLCEIDPLVKSTVGANPDIGAKVLKKSIEQHPGVPVSMRTAARARSNMLVAGSVEGKESYQDLPRCFEAFVQDSPGSMALVEVRCLV